MGIVCWLLIASFVGTLVSALGKLSLWVPVLLLNIAMLLSCLSLK
jgi:hypothetical protein